jgi:adenosine deaminase CECR1
MVGSTSMSIHGWRQLVEWSIKHSCLSKDEKEHAMQILKREWEEFCQWVIDKYGAHADSFDIKM